MLLLLLLPLWLTDMETELDVTPDVRADELLIVELETDEPAEAVDEPVETVDEPVEEPLAANEDETEPLLGHM